MSRRSKAEAHAIGNNGAARLLSLIERVERLEDERKTLAEDIKDIKREASSAGFDLKTFNRMLRERRMTEAELEDAETLAEIYRKALGILSDTPLGEAARKRLSRPPPAPPKPDGEAGDDADTEPPEDPDAPPEAGPVTAEQIAAAKAEGTQAAHAGRKVTENPHPAGDPRRGAWDEGWCLGAGSDGMDIPAAWRRSTKKK